MTANKLIVVTSDEEENLKKKKNLEIEAVKMTVSVATRRKIFMQSEETPSKKKKNISSRSKKKRSPKEGLNSHSLMLSILLTFIETEPSGI